MVKKIIINRRDFLRASAITAAGLVAAQCGAPATQAPPAATEAPPEATEAPEPTATEAPVAEEVTLDVMQIDEYEGQYEEIWSVYEAQNPGVKINVFPLNEDMAAAHNAKIAGGYLPAIELGTTLQLYFDGTNYETALDLSELDFPWWDRWTYDVKSAWSDLFGLPGPRSLEIYQGFIITWMWRTELMDRAGFNPREDVKTHEDFKTLLAEGAAWAQADPDVEYFWDVAWHNWAWGPFYMYFIPLSFADGQKDRQRDVYLGKAKFNDPDSPFRHTFEFFKEANDNGWIPERSWTRQWEPDMEGSYIGGKSVMMLHGPWPWDKMQANDPSVAQTGMPGFPPAEGMDPWIQGAFSPDVRIGYFIRAGNENTPHWPQTQHAFNWFFSPEAVPIRAQAEGRSVTYKLDEPLELLSPQYQEVVKEIGTPDGLWPDVVWDETLEGNVVANPYLKEGAKGALDWASNNNNQYWGDYLTDKITLQEVLDLLQSNWEESYEGLPT